VYVSRRFLLQALLSISQCITELDYDQRAQTSAKTKISTKMILDSNQDFRINPDSGPNICRIASKMLWIHYLVGVSHFAECRENRPVTV